MKSYLDIFEPIAKEMGVKIVHSKKVANDILEINIAYTDKVDSVDLETCAKVANAFAEATDFEIGLDVSSEGAERVIPANLFETVIGKHVYVKFKNPTEGMNDVEGELSEVKDSSICVKYRFKHTHKTIEIERENINLLRLAVKF
ncbi:MAG: ribosome assembly cofactor RimP [Erysipelothrix sp.]|nr:ribosome assembly cofactor RimP [Erysipelothrix sp.]